MTKKLEDLLNLPDSQEIVKEDQDKSDKIAKSEIAQIKVAVPNMALRVIDKAIQIHGGAGVSQDTPLARMYASMRTLRLADGPDEVHRRTVARLELGKHQAQAAKDGSPDVYVGRPS